eukprot:759640-Hanusia_phi.AAC.1
MTAVEQGEVRGPRGKRGGGRGIGRLNVNSTGLGLAHVAAPAGGGPRRSERMVKEGGGEGGRGDSGAGESGKEVESVTRDVRGEGAREDVVEGADKHRGKLVGISHVVSVCSPLRCITISSSHVHLPSPQLNMEEVGSRSDRGQQSLPPLSPPVGMTSLDGDGAVSEECFPPLSCSRMRPDREEANLGGEAPGARARAECGSLGQQQST